MPFEQHPLHALAAYLPDGSFEPVAAYLQQYKVHLTLTKKRKTILGDYRHAGYGKNHRISINSNLNKYEFLITLLHELAHLLTFEKFGNRVDAHGKEWKTVFGLTLIEFIEKKIFPADIEAVLKQSVMNPAATANGEVKLLMVLKKYNTENASRTGYTTVAAIPLLGYFITDDRRVFKKDALRRTRFMCTEVATGRKYSFSPLYEVKPYING